MSLEMNVKLWKAALMGTEEEVQEIISTGQADINWTNPSGGKITPLMGAIFKDSIGIVRILLNNGADIEKKNEYGFTPINTAAETHGNAEIISLLLKNGADPNEPNIFGNTPIYNAANNGFKEAVNVLLSGGANVDIMAIDVALEKGHNDIADILETWETAQVIPVFNEAGPYMGVGSMHNEDLIDLSEYMGRKDKDYGGRKKTIKKRHNKRMRKSNKKRTQHKK
jgi:hypothetical protein